MYGIMSRWHFFLILKKLQVSQGELSVGTQRQILEIPAILRELSRPPRFLCPLFMLNQRSFLYSRERPSITRFLYPLSLPEDTPPFPPIRELLARQPQDSHLPTYLAYLLHTAVRHVIRQERNQHCEESREADDQTRGVGLDGRHDAAEDAREGDDDAEVRRARQVRPQVQDRHGRRQQRHADQPQQALEEPVEPPQAVAHARVIIGSGGRQRVEAEEAAYVLEELLFVGGNPSAAIGWESRREDKGKGT